MAFPGRDTDAVGGTFRFLSSFQSQLNHESGPPGLKTDVLGLVVACDPAQQQQLPKQEETQRAVRWREHQTEAWRVRKTGMSCMVSYCAPTVGLFLLLTNVIFHT